MTNASSALARSINRTKFSFARSSFQEPSNPSLISEGLEIASLVSKVSPVLGN